MSSRWASGGTIAGDGDDEPSRPADEKPAAKSSEWDREAAKKNADWEIVQKELAAERQQREQARRANVEGGPGGEKSLYEVLQANKAAKQAAFEEENRIRNQFRALDDDEIDFLDSVNDERKLKEERVRKETEEGLERFRKAQRDAMKTVTTEEEADQPEETVEWANAGRKRKREKDVLAKGPLKGVKRRTSDIEKEEKKSEAENTASAKDGKASKKLDEKSPPAKPAPAAAATSEKPKLGLVSYDSDEDDD